MDHYFSMLNPDMKALVLNALGHGFDFEDVEIAAPVGREVLVDVHTSGLCSYRPHSSPLTISCQTNTRVCSELNSLGLMTTVQPAAAAEH